MAFTSPGSWLLGRGVNDMAMKAYRAWDNGSVENYMTIVFAENAREAKKIAATCEVCENAQWVDIRVKREPKADPLYKGRDEADWYDMETRLALVRDLGWACVDTDGDCDDCPGKKYCRNWEWEENHETD